ncbi:MAG TPA: 50S ribosomal protein L21 [Candidatus Hypogeohydataceae bacterium YC41]
MYAIIRDRGKQYKVSPGESILIDLIEGLKEKDPIEFPEVMVVGDETTKVGNPLITGVKVLAEVQGQVLGEKVRIIKFRRRENYRRRKGHRQVFTKVKIKEICV